MTMLNIDWYRVCLCLLVGYTIVTERIVHPPDFGDYGCELADIKFLLSFVVTDNSCPHSWLVIIQPTCYCLGTFR